MYFIVDAIECQRSSTIALLLLAAQLANIFSQESLMDGTLSTRDLLESAMLSM
jgi:hypothetical protein